MNQIRCIILLLTLLLTFQTYAQEYASKVTEAIIYPYGAKITRVATVNLKQGSNQLIFKDLEYGIEGNTLEISASNSLIDIQNINAHNQQKDAYTTNPKWQVLKDSLQILDYQKKWLDEQKYIYTEEEKIITRNAKLSTNTTATQISELKDYVLFYRKQLFEIRKEKIALDKELMELNKLRNEVGVRKNKLQKANQYNYQVHALVSTTSGQTMTFEFSYFLRNVSWTPIYDLKAQNTKSPMQLTYKAKIQQNTKIDWKGVKISLSTARPNKNKKQPVLNPLFAKFKTNVTPKSYTKEREESHGKVAIEYYAVPLIENDLKDDFAAPQQATELSTSVLFNIDGLRDIPSSSNAQFITIEKVNLPTNYQYVCIPKKDNQVYLIALLSDYGKYHLLNGKANLYFENTYIGQTTINPNTTLDSLEISLGQDASIVVERRIRDYTAPKVVRNSKKETYYFDINIRNNKSETVDIKILDQIPISKEKNIEVELLENGNGELCKDSKELEWIMKIPAHKSKEIKFSYEIKYPKDKVITIK